MRYVSVAKSIEVAGKPGAWHQQTRREAVAFAFPSSVIAVSSTFAKIATRALPVAVMRRNQEVTQFMRHGEAPAWFGDARLIKDDALRLAGVGYQGTFKTVVVEFADFDHVHRAGQLIDRDRRCPLRMMFEYRGEQLIRESAIRQIHQQLIAHRFSLSFRLSATVRNVDVGSLISGGHQIAIRSTSSSVISSPVRS